MAVRLVVVAGSRAALDRGLALLDGADADILTDPLPPSAGPGAGQSHLAQAIELAVERSRTTEAVVAAFAGGLVIPALGYDWLELLAPRGAIDEIPGGELARRLLRRMRDLEGERRACCWSEAAAVAAGGRLIGAWEANGPPGRIAGEYAPPADAAAHWPAGLCAPPPEDDLFRVLAPPLRDLLGRLGEPNAGAVANDEAVAFEGGE